MRPTLVPLSLIPLALILGCGSGSTPPAATPPATTAASTSAGSSGTDGVSTAAPAVTTGAPAADAPSASTASTGSATTAAPPADVAVGAPAPDFSATDQDGKPVHLADLKGHSVVVYFYPKDETPGCTHEACSFRDAWNDLKRRGVVIIGISMDSAASHKAFAQNHQLPFVLVSDSSGEIAKKYGVPTTDGYTKRQSFVVAPDGNVKKIYRTVDVTKHAHEIAADTAS